jgi:Lrp/AsnC family transcriptional regulator, leucine-responsive regulatory protein
MIDSTVDEIDLKLISVLKKNSRLSFVDLGKAINLSPSATRGRLQKLEDNGIIKKYDIKIDYKLLGYDVEAFILVKVFHGKLKTFLNAINNFQEVIEAHRITGNLNVHLKVIVKNQLHLQKVIDQLIFFGDTNTFLILSQISKKN